MPYPGFQFTTIGGKIQQIVEAPTTERLLILGTALDGPLNTPIRVTSMLDVEAMFGPAVYINGYVDPITGTNSGQNAMSSLSLAAAAAFEAGCTDVWCVRYSGSYATAPSAFGGKLDITSVYPGRLYNSVKFTSTISGSSLVLTVDQPAIKGGSFTTTVGSSVTIGQLIDTLNGDSRNRTFYINKETYPTYHNLPCTALGSGVVQLSGGTYGTRARGEDYEFSVSGLAQKLVAPDLGTFDALIGQRFKFHIAVLTGIYLDDQVTDSGNTAGTSIAIDYAAWLDRTSVEYSPCHGVIGCRPHGLRDPQRIADYVNNSLLAKDVGFYSVSQRWIKAGPVLYNGFKRTDPVAGTVDMGMRLSVTAGPDAVLTHPQVGTYSDSFHVPYAALLTQTPPEKSPIFKPLRAVVAYTTPFPAKLSNKMVEGVGFNPSNDLSGQGAYVTVTRDPRRDFGSPLVVFDDCTATSRDDYFRNYQVVHLCNSIENDLNVGLIGFLGEPTDIRTQAAIETTIVNILDGYAESNGLKGRRGQGYDFKIYMNGVDQMLGTIRIDIELAPATSLRRIYFTVAIRRPS